MNIKSLIKKIGAKAAEEKAAKLGAGVFSLGAIASDILVAIKTDGFQLHDLIPLLSLEGLGTLGFLLLYLINRKNKKESK